MGAPAAPNQVPPQRKAQPVRVEQKVGRNEPCPCGSGKSLSNVTVNKKESNRSFFSHLRILIISFLPVNRNLLFF